MENRLWRLEGPRGGTNGTFVLIDEGHTLGNALSSVIGDYPGVKLCGYTIPHPAENKIHLNIQTVSEDVVEVLRRGFQDLEKMCDYTIEQFDEAYKKYKSKDASMDTT